MNNKNNELSEQDKELCKMFAGLTPELIAQKTVELNNEYNSIRDNIQKLESTDIKEEDIYRGFIGFKIAALLSAMGFVLDEIDMTKKAVIELADVMEDIMNNDPVISKPSKPKTKRKTNSKKG